MPCKDVLFQNETTTYNSLHTDVTDNIEKKPPLKLQRFWHYSG